MQNESVSGEYLNWVKFFSIGVSLVIFELILVGLLLILGESPKLTQIIELFLDKTNSSYLQSWIISIFSFCLLLCFKLIEFYPEILKRSGISATRSHIKNSRDLSIWIVLLDVGIVLTSVRSNISQARWDYTNLTSCKELFLFVLMPYMIMFGISYFWNLASVYPLLISLLKQKSTSVVIRASELGYPCLPKTEKASLGRFVALKIQPNFKEWKGIYRINYYGITQELDDRIHNYFKRKL